MADNLVTRAIVENFEFVRNKNVRYVRSVGKIRYYRLSTTVCLLITIETTKESHRVRNRKRGTNGLSTFAVDSNQVTNQIKETIKLRPSDMMNRGP